MTQRKKNPPVSNRKFFQCINRSSLDSSPLMCLLMLIITVATLLPLSLFRNGEKSSIFFAEQSRIPKIIRCHGGVNTKKNGITFHFLFFIRSLCLSHSRVLCSSGCCGRGCCPKAVIYDTHFWSPRDGILSYDWLLFFHLFSAGDACYAMPVATAFRILPDKKLSA